MSQEIDRFGGTFYGIPIEDIELAQIGKASHLDLSDAASAVGHRAFDPDRTGEEASSIIGVTKEGFTVLLSGMDPRKKREILDEAGIAGVVRSVRTADGEHPIVQQVPVSADDHDAAADDLFTPVEDEALAGGDGGLMTIEPEDAAVAVVGE